MVVFLQVVCNKQILWEAKSAQTSGPYGSFLLLPLTLKN